MPRYPETRREEVTDVLHGRAIPDPYRWLEEENPEVDAWVDAQNAVFAEDIRTRPDFIEWRNAVKARVWFDTASIPYRRGPFVFQTRRRAHENGHVLYVTGPDGERRPLVDMNAHDPSGKTTLDSWHPTRDGRLLAYSTFHGGSEIGSVKILEVATGRAYPEEIPRTWHVEIRWLPDGSGFFYSRLPDPAAAPAGEELYHARVYFHRVGSGWEDDEMIFGEGRSKLDAFGCSVSRDGRWLLITARNDWQKTEVYLRDLRARGSFVPVAEGIPAIFHPRIAHGRLYLRTNLGAPNWRVIAADPSALPADLSAWEEIVPERAYPLEGLQVAKEHLVLDYMRDVATHLEVCDPSGRDPRPIPIPAASSADASAHEEESEVHYQVTSFTVPWRTYRYDPSTDVATIIEEFDLDFRPEDYTIEQIWSASTDGTRVPSYVVRRSAGPAGPRPTILSGYGGFGISQLPGYMGSIMAFVDRGGAFAIANIRGGGEFGEAWHEGGVKERKQQSFDDFLSVARDLVARGITTPARLAIRGGSNGGLLVGAAAVQGSELFGAVHCIVPLLDMVRFPRFLMAARWTAEYGDPEREEDLERILRWSPYHNVVSGRRYPPILFQTANKDTRVHPLHARKMAALLQAQPGTGEVYLKTIPSGHQGAGRTREETIDDLAEALTFLWKHVGDA